MATLTAADVFSSKDQPGSFVSHLAMAGGVAGAVVVGSKGWRAVTKIGERTLPATTKFAGRALPIVGEGLFAYDAGSDARSSYNNRNITRTITSGTEAALYTGLGIAAAGAAANFWNPIGWGLGLAVGGAALTLTAWRKANDWGVLGLGDSDRAQAAAQAFVAGLPTPDQLKTSAFARVRDPEGNFDKVVELYAQHKEIDGDVLAAISKLTQNQRDFLNLSDDGRLNINKNFDLLIEVAMKVTQSPDGMKSLLSTQEIQQNEKMKALVAEPDPEKRRTGFGRLSLEELNTLNDALEKMPEPPSNAVAPEKHAEAIVAPTAAEAKTAPRESLRLATVYKDNGADNKSPAAVQPQGEKTAPRVGMPSIGFS